MSMQQWGQGGRPPSMRASNADRERTVDVLKAGFAEGRLGRPEYEQRVESALSAQTYGALHMLVADLPQGPNPVPPAYQQPMRYPVPYPAQYPQSFGPPVPFPHVYVPPSPNTNGKAVGALVCASMVPMCGVTAIPAVILGHKAQAEIRRTGENGDGMALAGVIVGWLAIALGTLFILLGVFA